MSWFRRPAGGWGKRRISLEGRQVHRDTRRGMVNSERGDRESLLVEPKTPGGQADSGWGSRQVLGKSCRGI